MTRLIPKFAAVTVLVIILFCYTFSSLYGRHPKAHALDPDPLAGLKDESLQGASQQQPAHAVPPPFVVSSGNGATQEQAKPASPAQAVEEEKQKIEEEKKRIEEEQRKAEEEKKKIEEEKKRIEEEQRKVEEEKKKAEEERQRKEKEKQEQEKQDRERKKEEIRQKAIEEYKKIKIYPGTFDVPKDLVHDPQGPKPNEIVLLAASDGKGHNGGIENILGDITPNRQDYAALHGYIYQFLNISKYDIGSAHPVWAKLPAIVETFNLHPQAKWIWWLDLDAIIMTPTVDLRTHILAHDVLQQKMLKGHTFNKAGGGELKLTTPTNQNINNIDIIVSQDHNGLNAGSFWIRRSEFSRMFIDMWSDPMYVRENWIAQEQDAMMHLIKEHPTVLEHVALVPQRTINSYPLKDHKVMGWYPGDLVVHIAGCWVENKCNSQWVEYMAKRTPAPKPGNGNTADVPAAPATPDAATAASKRGAVAQERDF